MTDDDQPPRHVRHERKTREHFGLVGNGEDMHPAACIAWCDVNATNEWFFGDAAHVLAELAYGGGIEPCHACLRAMRAVIDAELGDEP